MKDCSKCKVSKPSEDFSVDKRIESGLRSWCKACEAEYQQEYCFSKMVRLSRIADEKYGRDSSLEYITEESIEGLLVKQGGGCFYCHTTMVHGAGVNRKTNEDAVTIERIDNEVPHIVENCVLACHGCNARRNHWLTFDEMVTNGADMKTNVIRKCSDCKAFLPLSSFYSNKCKDSGVAGVCKECSAPRDLAKSRKTRAARTPDEVDEFNRKRRLTRKPPTHEQKAETNRKKKEKWDALTPEERKAKSALTPEQNEARNLKQRERRAKKQKI